MICELHNLAKVHFNNLSINFNEIFNFNKMRVMLTFTLQQYYGFFVTVLEKP